MKPGESPVLTLRQHALVREAMPVVEQCARKVCGKYRPLVEFDDMCTVGKLALYDAAPRFQEGRNRSFARFARYRVSGAMMNEVICASAKERVDRDILRALINLLADYADDFNILKHDKGEMQRRMDLMCGSAAAVMFVVGAHQATVEAERDIVADVEENVVAREALRAVMRGLTSDQRQLIILLFAHGFDQHEVGDLTGVAHETVCRRLARLLAELKRLLKAFDVTRAPPRVQLPGLRPVLEEPEEDEPEEDEPEEGTSQEGGQDAPDEGAGTPEKDGPSDPGPGVGAAGKRRRSKR